MENFYFVDGTTYEKIGSTSADSLGLAKISMNRLIKEHKIVKVFNSEKQLIDTIINDGNIQTNKPSIAKSIVKPTEPVKKEIKPIEPKIDVVPEPKKEEPKNEPTQVKKDKRMTKENNFHPIPIEETDIDILTAELLTFEDVSKIYKCSVPTIKRLVMSGKIKAIKIGGKVRIPKQWVNIQKTNK